MCMHVMVSCSGRGEQAGRKIGGEESWRMISALARAVEEKTSECWAGREREKEQ